MPVWQGAPAVLHEPLDGPGARRRWRAESEGRPATALEAQLSSVREAVATGERLRRLHSRPSPYLTPVLAWAVEGTTAWAVIAEAPGAQSLATVLRRGSLSAGEAAAITWALLSALEVMHDAQVAHGSVSSASVLVDAHGGVRLDGNWFVPEPRAGVDGMVADIEGAGAVGQAALGAAPTGAASTPAELAAPALSRMLRAIAAGASGSNAAGARMALSATAGPLVEAAGLERAREALAARVRAAGGAPEAPAAGPPPRDALAPVPTSLPAVVAPAPAPPAVPAVVEPAPAAREAVPAPSVRSARYVASAADFEELREPFDWSRLALPLLVVGGILVLLAGGVLAVRALGHRSPAAATTPSHQATRVPTPSPAPTATRSATPTPVPSPSFGPLSAPPVKSVALTLSGCAPGGRCAGEIIVTTSAAPAANDVQWTVRAFDPCTGATTDAGSGHFTEQQGWTSIDVNQAVTLPAARGQLLVAAVTSAPASASSSPVTVGQGGC